MEQVNAAAALSPRHLDIDMAEMEELKGHEVIDDMVDDEGATPKNIN